ncbi:MAG: DUF697 domain-containing protein [Alkalinema sp. RU_4_3]|nr:DUF697 domain-containing protein [Alkalinema sp. RU_4_3]
MDFDRAKINLEQNLANLRQKLPSFKPSLPKFSKPGLPTTEDVVGWFSLDEKRLAEILQQVRSSLPTTEAILVGKPQAGKSSIVRAITGVSPEIVGQGYRPHTSHTERYSFPDADLPLLIFTDTVGLGDGQNETSEVVQELLGSVETDKSQAKVIILTVKINDFATDTLRTIAQSIRSRHPEIPCLLAVTCLHEAYPDVQMDHPAYPPEIAEVDRAFKQISRDFAGLFDRAILVDFTLEEDGYREVFYGLDKLMEDLSALLPKAEAKAMQQLLGDRDTEQIGNLYRATARRYIAPFAIMAGALAAVPLPLATMPVLTAVQVSMVGLLGRLYGQQLTPSQAGGVVSAIAGGFIAQAIGRELVKFIPGFGAVIAASWATAYTVSLGEAAVVYFGDLMGGKKPDGDRIQDVMQEQFQATQNQLKSRGQ